MVELQEICISLLFARKCRKSCEISLSESCNLHRTQISVTINATRSTAFLHPVSGKLVSKLLIYSPINANWKKIKFSKDMFSNKYGLC